MSALNRDVVQPGPKSPALTPTLQDILQAIIALREALGTKIDTLGTDLGLLRDDHRYLTKLVTGTDLIDIDRCQWLAQHQGIATEGS
ncbi:hypothetical protein NDU88_003209 [Pleurodeles waltl]|uniref:Uncharacterized protein n=1 Tax=Pleurodeles waltl TaxID=8319 RepID=A0AAV7UFD2_PLEWA|nr:hypothetical protein NDU88_003209 [Pleurodeles waltl]